MSEDLFIIKPQIEVKVTQQDIDDMMATALEGGITYWCGKAEVVGEFLGICASEQISRGGSLILHDIESPDTWELTLDKFLNGVKLYLESRCYGKLGGGFSVEEGDIESDVDSVIQYALFGDLEFS